MPDASKTSGSSPPRASRDAGRPIKPANYDNLEHADQVAHHVAVIKWNEAHPEIVKAEKQAEHEKKMAANRAERLAQIAEIEADLEAGSKMKAPPVRPTKPRYPDDEDGTEAELEHGTPEYEAHHAEWDAYSKAERQYNEAHETEELKVDGRYTTRGKLAFLRKCRDEDDRQEKATAAFLAKYGDGKSEPPRERGDISYEVFHDAHDAWTEAHPEVIAKRDAKRDAEYDAWINSDDPEAVEARAEQAERAIEDAAKEVKDAASLARRIKREAKDPAAALEKALDAAKRNAIEDSGEKDEAKKDARESGEAWGDIKDEWEETWIEDNWGAEDEAASLVEFENHWLKDHGTPYPVEVEAKPEPVKLSVKPVLVLVKNRTTPDAALAVRIGDEYAAWKAADAMREETAKALGRSLVEARKLHPSEKAFTAFLKTVPNGFGIRRAQELMAFAKDKKDFAQHAIAHASAQKRHRDKRNVERVELLALPKPEPIDDEPEPDRLNKSKNKPASRSKHEKICREREADFVKRQEEFALSFGMLPALLADVVALVKRADDLGANDDGAVHYAFAGVEDGLKAIARAQTITRSAMAQMRSRLDKIEASRPCIKAMVAIGGTA